MISLEFYEHGDTSGDMLLHMIDVHAVPRVGDRCYLRRVDRILGVDPDKEHPYWRVVEVEWWFDGTQDTKSRLTYGHNDQVAIWVKRINQDGSDVNGN